MQAVIHFLSAAVIMKLTKLRLDRSELLSYRELLVCFVFGLLPDADILLQGMFRNLPLHRAFTHNIFLPIILCAIGLLLYKYKISKMFFLASLAFAVHIGLDLLLGSMIILFPVNTCWIGMHWCYRNTICSAITMALDAVALFSWLALRYYRTTKIKTEQ
jgi:membrane-bound metal-dependent hydrolase YbcI (DUF457 family)